MAEASSSFCGKELAGGKGIDTKKSNENSSEENIIAQMRKW